MALPRRRRRRTAKWWWRLAAGDGEKATSVTGRLDRQDELNFRSSAALAFETELAAQTMGHDVVDDMQPKAGAAVVTTRREEWIEGLSPDVGSHATTVVGEQDFD